MAAFFLSSVFVIALDRLKYQTASKLRHRSQNPAQEAFQFIGRRNAPSLLLF